MKNKETSEKASGFSESRRSFIKKSGAAAAGLAAAPTLLGSKVFGKAPAPGSVLGANDRLVAGFIGVGGQGFNAHLLSGVVIQSREQNVVGAVGADVWQKRKDNDQEAMGISTTYTYT